MAIFNYFGSIDFRQHKSLGAPLYFYGKLFRHDHVTVQGWHYEKTNEIVLDENENGVREDAKIALRKF